MNVFLCRGVRAGLYGANDPSITKVVDDAGTINYSETFLSDPHHTLHHIRHLLPNNLELGATIDSYYVN